MGQSVIFQRHSSVFAQETVFVPDFLLSTFYAHFLLMFRQNLRDRKALSEFCDITSGATSSKCTNYPHTLSIQALNLVKEALLCVFSAFRKAA